MFKNAQLVVLNPTWPSREAIKRCSQFSRYDEGRINTHYKRGKDTIIDRRKDGVYQVTFPNGTSEEFHASVLMGSR